MNPARLVLAATALLLLPAAAAPGTVPPAEASSPAQAAFDEAIAAAKTAMMADPRAALAQADRALQRSAALPGRDGAVARATALWLRTEALIGLNRLTEAQEQVGQALALASRHVPRSKLQGDLVKARGFIAGMQGRPQQALADLLAAFDLFRSAGEPRSQALVLQELGQIYWEAGDADRMLRYNRQAEELYSGDPAIDLATHNNTGEALRRLGRWQEAESNFMAAAEDARALGSPLLQARVLGNLALAQVDGNKLAAAGRNADRALAFSLSEDSASWRSTAYGVLAKVAAAQGDDARAARWLDRAFAGKDLTRTDAKFR